MRAAVLVLALAPAAFVSVALTDGQQRPTQPQSLDLSTITASDTVVLQHGQLISGTVTCRAFTVPIGVTAFVDEDLELNAGTDIIVAGRLVARDRTMDDSELDGIKITLIADSAIYVPGNIQGGRGRDAAAQPFTREHEGLPGGHGSDIEFRALINIIDGMVVGGPGGTSGPGAKGPRGGNVHVHGYNWTSLEDSIGIVGGDGGTNGQYTWERGPNDLAADGADGGDAISHGPDPADDNPDKQLLAQRIFFYHVDSTKLAYLPTALDGGKPEWIGMGKGHPAQAEFMLPVGAPQEGCPDINPATAPMGGNSTGGGGMEGDQGMNGDVNHNDGYPGGQGGTGGKGEASKGDDGLTGNSCCPPQYDPPPNPGGKGQNGGDGGIGTGGPGGPGGTGGNGINDGDGGVGGLGGVGGDGISKDGGMGGAGGAQYGPAGAGGRGKLGVAGSGGPGGDGGEGAGMGSDGGMGMTGPDGGMTDGMDGNTNNQGGPCPTPPGMG